MFAFYLHSCPNCGGKISSEELEKKGICPICAEKKEGRFYSFLQFRKKVEEEIEKFEEIMGKPPHSLQQTWIKKLLLRRSFSILAPPGIGKTTFGIFASIRSKGKVLFVLPTTALVEHVYERIQKVNEGKSVIAIHSKMRRKEKKENEEKAKKGEFDILLLTSNYLYKHYEELSHGYDLVFVDDVDSLMKGSKNIDKLLRIVGFSEEEIGVGFQLIKLRRLVAMKKESPEKIEELKKKIGKKDTILILSSATGKPRGSRVKLFYELLGFEIGVSASNIRKVVDTYVFAKNLNEALLYWIRKIGMNGGLIFVSSVYGKEKVNEIVRLLNESGIEAISYEELTEENIKKFRSGEIRIIVGIASYRNPLARGLDFPETVRYAIFYGVPRFEFNLSIEDPNPAIYMAILLNLREIFGNECLKYIGITRKALALPFRYKEQLEEVKKYLISKLSEKEIQEKINARDDLTLKVDGGITLVVADIAGYLQASGRTSRLYAGGITTGLSLILVDEQKSFNNLQKKMSWFLEQVKFEKIEEINLDEIRGKIEEEREKIKTGKIGEGLKIEQRLVIVESPNKARTIARMFSRRLTRRTMGNMLFYEFMVGNTVYLIGATIGHVVDLVTKQGYYGIYFNEHVVPIFDYIKRCKDSGKQFVDELDCEYESKEEIIEALREICKEVDTVVIATDPDTEGEKIGYDVKLLLSPFAKNIVRAEFHAVTKKEIMNAFENPREFNVNLVDAQVVRRIADRIVGFELSNEIKKKFGEANYSLGRVQTPVLRWIIERYNKHKEKIYAITLNTEVGRFYFTSEEKVEKVDEIEIEVLETFDEELSPPTPFTTEEMISEAAAKLRFSASKTMKLAQSLFEKGLITYHRTDSFRVSSDGLRIAKEWIEKNYSSQYFVPRTYKGSEGAHECIRPTRAFDVDELRSLIYAGIIPTTLSRDEAKLYDLIFARFIASQMEKAKVRKAKIKVKVGEKTFTEERIIEIEKYGFLNVLKEDRPTQPLFSGRYKVLEMHVRKIPKVRLYSEGDVVREMKERGIGRPSTYAVIISTLKTRGYVFEKNNVLIPTKKGIEAIQFANENYPHFTSEEFTRELEKMMDEVEKGRSYEEVAKYIYRKLMEVVRRAA